MFKPGKILGSFDTSKNEIKWRKTVTHTHNSKTSQFWTRLDNKYGMNYFIFYTNNAKKNFAPKKGFNTNLNWFINFIFKNLNMRSKRAPEQHYTLTMTDGWKI